MEEKKITKAEFDAAMAKATEIVMKDAREKVGGLSAFIIPLAGTMLAKEMRDILSPEDETEGNEEC
jgi:hypothetical protein